MILSPHAIVGAAIANLAPEHPELGFVLAVGSHYMLDMIPHRDYDIDGFFDRDAKSFKSIIRNFKAQLTLLMIAADFAVGIGIAFLIFARSPARALATLLGILGGVLPDLLQFFYYTFKKRPWTITQKVHDFFHSENRMLDKPVTGSVVQVCAIILFVGAYFLFK